MDNVAVLLSTYNGEKYLEEQIDSIRNQSYENWKLYIRDDGSSDTTINIIEKYCKVDDRIIFLDSNRNNLGVIDSFLFLLTEVTADYYMFCDQDDIWLENKIKNTLFCMKEKEKEEKKPYVIYTDLRVVDANLNIIAPSIFEYRKLFKAPRNYMSIFIRNSAYGCTIMFNNQLKNLVVKSDNIIMHDKWIEIIGASFGETCLCPDTDILYRRHGDNTSATKKYGKLSYLTSRLTKILSFIKGGKGVQVQNLLLQANAFSGRYRDKLSESKREQLDAFLMLPKVSRIKRLKILLENDIRMETTLLTINFYILVLLMGKTNLGETKEIEGL